MLQQIIFWCFKVNTFSLDRPGRQRPWERGHTWGTSNLSYSPVIVAMLSHLGFQITYSGTEKSGGHHGHSHSAENMNMRGESPTLMMDWQDVLELDPGFLAGFCTGIPQNPWTNALLCTALLVKYFLLVTFITGYWRCKRKYENVYFIKRVTFFHLILLPSHPDLRGFSSFHWTSRSAASRSP